MKKLSDFGEKIGGAKKDLWQHFSDLSEDEQQKMARRDAVWKKEAPKDIPDEVAFWQNEMRKSVKPKPDKDPEGFMKFCLSFKADVKACISMTAVEEFYRTSILKYMEKLDEHTWKYREAKYASFFDAKKALRYVNNPDQIRCDCMAQEKLRIREVKAGEVTSNKKDSEWVANVVKTPGLTTCVTRKENWEETAKISGSLFLVTKGFKVQGMYLTREDASCAIEAERMKKKNKKSFLPPHLEDIKRDGSDYRFFRMGDGNVLMARYGLRGGEFGNWATAKDRLLSVNMAYDAFEDLRNALGIKAKDISLGGDLAIAFGARGQGNALAHYEMLHNVINITRLRGAGSLAHEWGHALDRYAGKAYGKPGFLSKAREVPDVMDGLMDSFKYLPDGSRTKFYSTSRRFDMEYKKSGNGYWSSPQEMFARAFACYVLDKLDGKQSDYLVGHAECAASGGLAAFPVGEERKMINAKFDRFFDLLKEKEILHSAAPVKEERTKEADVSFFEGDGGQMMFC